MNRGNSGIFFLGLYELQVFESYHGGIYADGQAAAIYGQYPPLVNVSRAPGQWQVFDEFLEVYRRESPEVVAFDTESSSWKWHLPESVPFAMSFSWSKEHTYYVPCSLAGAVDQDAVEALREVMLTAPTLVCHNALYDLHVAKRLFDVFDMPFVVRRIEDTMLMDAVLDDQRHHGLKELCKDLDIRFSDEDPDRLKAQVAAWREQQSELQGRPVGYDEVPLYLMVPYARQDAYLTRELYRHSCTEMDEQVGKRGKRNDLHEIYALELRVLWGVADGGDHAGERCQASGLSHSS